jgi:hypothetical protein
MENGVGRDILKVRIEQVFEITRKGVHAIFRYFSRALPASQDVLAPL